MAITQETRRCKVTSPLGEDALFLTSLDASERVSGLFQFDCRFVSGDEELDFAKIVGQSVTLELEVAGGEARYFNGRVARFSQSNAEGSGPVYQAQLVPWFWFLTRRTDCRIFQGDSVTQILEKVLGEHKQIADFKLDIEGKYDPIPYCVQYRETDFNFASRLMEEWGIGYYFEHSEKAHKMVLFDAPSKIVACPGQAKASCKTAASDEKTAGTVSDWHVQKEFRSGAYALTDYNFRDPSLDLGVQKKTRNAVGGNDAFEIFDYPGDYQTLGAGDKRAQLRMEAEECAANAIHGGGSCYAFTPGYKFDLVGHVRGSFNDAYLLTEVHHTFSQTLGAGRNATASDYRNSFSCVPHAIPYRPLQTTPKSVIQGVQTAIVVGEEGKEIDIDGLACVYVKFHWDRFASGDASSSCPVRVAQAWAGKEWGAFFAPRIGQEVIVEFVEGDPDRPIVTGCLYNAEQIPPYGLPAKGTQSGIRSRSSPGADAAHFNEIRFEDKKDGEEIYIHAERALTTVVEASESRSVGENRTTTIQKNDEYFIKEGDRTETFEKGSQKLTIQMGNDTRLVETGTIESSAPVGTHRMQANSVVVEGITEIKLTCGSSIIHLTPVLITISGAMVKIN